MTVWKSFTDLSLKFQGIDEGEGGRSLKNVFLYTKTAFRNYFGHKNSNNHKYLQAREYESYKRTKTGDGITVYILRQHIKIKASL